MELRQIEIILPELKNYKGISYFKYTNDSTSKTVLFIHGLGLNKEFFRTHLDQYHLNDYSWIVPDLLGHGLSNKYLSLFPYTMRFQAEQILQILLHEDIHDLIIVSHSMGSPVAYYLLESIFELNTIKTKEEFSLNVLLYVSVEGNVDENDAFFSGKIVANSWQDFSRSNFQGIITDIKEKDSKYYETVKYCKAWDLYACSLDLVKISKAEITLPLIERIKNSIPVKILYGEKNKGVFTSENVLQTYFTIDYIPDSGHNMLADNPEGFWKLIMHFIGNLH